MVRSRCRNRAAVAGVAGVIEESRRGFSVENLVAITAVSDEFNQPEERKSLLARACEGFLILGVRGYQVTLGPFLGGHCRFEPSCSNYFIQAVRKHGAIRGAVKGVWRVCRCNPFCEGGYDPP